MLGQDFCGQSGQGFAGLWQGMSPTAADMPDLEPASECADATGASISDPSMAIMPRRRDHRWKIRMFKWLKCPCLLEPRDHIRL